VDETVVSEGDVEAKLRAAVGGALPDIVIDATGSNRSMSNAFGYIAPTGRLVDLFV